jgi:hypothetical protein
MELRCIVGAADSVRLMRTSLVWLGMIACGGSPKPEATTTTTTTQSARGSAAPAAPDDATYAKLACNNLIATPTRFRCAFLEKIGMTPQQCPGFLSGLMDEATTDGERAAFRQLMKDLANSPTCDGVMTAFQTADAAARRADASTPVPGHSALTKCEVRADGAYNVGADELKLRRGTDDKLFSDTHSTETTPIEVCAVRGELGYLLRLTCADGSRPWGSDAQKAYAARKGSVTAPGRCSAQNAAIDLYDVPCPERHYAVYIDMYECGPGERFE